MFVSHEIPRSRSNHRGDPTHEFRSTHVRVQEVPITLLSAEQYRVALAKMTLKTDAPRRPESSSSGRTRQEWWFQLDRVWLELHEAIVGSDDALSPGVPRRDKRIAPEKS